MFFILFILLINLTLSEDNECHILVLGGGGDRGAWQVGAIKALTEFTDHKYDIVSGSSIGGINAGLFSQAELGKEKEGAELLWDFWSSISAHSFYKNWNLGILEGFFAKGGLFDTSVAEKTFHEWFNHTKFRASKRHVYFGTAEVGTEDLKMFNETADDILAVLTASAAIPGIFPPKEIDGKYYTDGGFKAQSPITLPISKCEHKYGKEDVKVIVDVVYCISRIAILPKFIEETMITPFVLIDTLMGFVNDLLLNDFQYAKEAFPDAEINVYMPDEWLPGVFILFEHKQMVEMMEMGYKETKKKILGE